MNSLWWEGWSIHSWPHPIVWVVLGVPFENPSGLGFCMVRTQPFPPWIEQLLLEFLLAFLWLLVKQCPLTSEDFSKHVVEALIRDTESFAGLEFFIYRTNIFLGCNCPQETDYTLLSQVEVFVRYLGCWSDFGLYKHMDFCPAEFTARGDRKAEGFRQTGEHNRVLKDEKWAEPWNRDIRCWFVSIGSVHYYFINLLA